MHKRVLTFLVVLTVLVLVGSQVADARGWHHTRQARDGHNQQTTTTTTKPTTTTRPTTTTVKPTTTTTSQATTTTTSSSRWTLEFSEDFNTNAAEGQFLNTYSNFEAYPYNWKDTSGFGTYQPNILSVSGGNLQIGLRTQNGEHLVAAPEPLVNNGSKYQLYGKYEVRFKADQIADYKTAWLLWPQSDQWSDGEIDFPEGDLDGNINAFNHYSGDPTNQDGYSANADFGQWHVAVTQWEPGKVTFSLDGKVIGTSTTHVMNKPARLVLQTETALGQGEPASNVSGTVYLDYVKAWKYTG